MKNKDDSVYKDPRWQKKRLEVFERDKWKCKICESTERTLCVHHLFYIKNLEPWEISNGFLITLCEDCHSQVSENEDYIDLVEALGDLLNSLWKREFDFFSIVNLECAILSISQLPKTTPDKWNFDLKVNICPESDI